MIHAALAAELFAFALGLVAFGGFFLIYRTGRSPLIKSYLLYLVAMLLQLLVSALGLYVSSFGTGDRAWISPWYRFSTVFFLGVFAYVASRFFLEFADIGFEGAPRRLVISLSAAVLAVSPLAFIKGGPVFISILPSLAGLIVFLFAMLYSQLRLVFAYGRIRDRLGRIGIPTILAYNIVCIAGCTLDSIVSGQQLAAGAWPFGVLVQPLLYLAWNILSLAWALAYEGSGTIGNSASLEPDPVAARRFGITDRELELARLLAKGAANKEIAAVLGLSPNTVRNHVHNIFEKTGARNRVELVRALCDRGGVAS